jgi:hypothetical protein
MQILSRKTDVGHEEVYVQQITVSGTHDGKLSDACDSIWEQLTGLGFRVQFRDDAIGDEARARVLDC